MPEVEEVPGAAARPVEHVERLRLDDLPRSEEDGGVEVPLHCAVRHLRPALVERNPPVEPDHVAARRCHLLQERGGTGAEMDRRHVDCPENGGRMRGDVLAIVRGRERADPGVEHLDHVRAGARLGGDVGAERGGELLEQRVPDVGLAEHEALRVRELPTRLPLDEVARHGERAAAEADDGLVGPELRRTIRTASSTGPKASSGSGTRSFSTSASVRTGSSTTGPTPSTSRTSTPIPSTGVMMSANITAASTSCRRTGCSVTSAHSSGVWATSKKLWRSRRARYSGSERPAWRMNQTGVRSTSSRRAARTRSGSFTD